MARRIKRKAKRVLKLCLFIIILLCCFAGYKYFSKGSVQNNNEVTNTTKVDTEKIKKEKYDKCMSEPYKMDTLDEEFNALLSNYKDVGIYFTDVKNEYSYYVNKDKGYYSGCVTKLFGAIYLVEQAREGKIDLHSTLTYLPEDKHAYSDLTDQHKFYEEIPITTLMNYFLTISDNTAYFIIIRNIGADTLNKYFKEKYGLTLHFTNNHPFERQYTAELGNESLKILNKLLEVDDEYSDLIRESMNNNEENSLNFDNVKFLHKYGEHSVYHNDIGIYDDEDYPYLISILTLYAKEDYNGKISGINKKIYELYKKNLDSKQSYCQKISNGVY
jgi:hypothetical protein